MSNKLKYLRKEKGLTLDDLAKNVGIKRGTLNNYENEKTEPKLETWKKLAEYFDVSIGYLQGLSDIKNPYKSENYLFENKGKLHKSKDFNLEDFKREGDERVAEFDSESLTEILTILSEQAHEDDYNNLITNRDTRAFIYNLIETLVGDAIFGGVDSDYLINGYRIIEHFNRTMRNLKHDDETKDDKSNKTN